MTQSNRVRGNGEGSVYRRERPVKDPTKPPSVCWIAQVKIDGKVRRTMHPSEALAKQALRKMMAEVDAGRVVADGSETVGSLLTRWEERVLPAQNLTVNTLDTYAWACRILREDIGRVRLKRLTAEHVEKAFEKRATDDMSRASLIKIRSVLGKALDYALRRQLVNQNVARIVELPAAARRQKKGRALTADQAKAILAESAGHPLHALWVVMLYLGVRPGEVTGLTWKDIDFDEGLVHIRRARRVERGEQKVEEQLKTDRSRRTLAAPPPVLDALRDHRRRQNETRLRAGAAWTDQLGLVFTTETGNSHNPSNLRRTLSRITNRLDLGDWHPHELRHTAASLMSEAGVPIERIADQLGHDGTRMSLLVYRHATKPSVDAGNVMSNVLS